MFSKTNTKETPSLFCGINYLNPKMNLENDIDITPCFSAQSSHHTDPMVIFAMFPTTPNPHVEETKLMFPFCLPDELMKAQMISPIP